MDDKLKPYLLAAILSHIADRQTAVRQDYLNREDTLDQITSLLDRRLPSRKLEWAFDELAGIGVITKINDEFAGDFFKININRAVDEITRESQIEGSLIQKYRLVGPAFLNGVIDHFKELDSDESDHMPLESGGAAPASDRLVRLDHNQISNLDSQILELVNELEAKDIGDPDHPGLRERILGQIRAGRELVLSGQFKAYLLYEVLVKALGELIEKYGNPTIKVLANALLDAIVSQIFQGQ